MTDTIADNNTINPATPQRDDKPAKPKKQSKTYQYLLDQLNYKQQLFVKLYAGNATEAAKAAGYSERTAYKQGSLLINKSDVISAIKARDRNKIKPNDGKQAQILGREALQQFWSETIIDPEVPYKDRIAASERLAKSLGMFIDRLQVEDITDKTDTDLERILIEQLAVLGIRYRPQGKALPMMVSAQGDGVKAQDVDGAMSPDGAELCTSV